MSAHSRRAWSEEQDPASRLTESRSSRSDGTPSARAHRRKRPIYLARTEIQRPRIWIYCETTASTRSSSPRLPTEESWREHSDPIGTTGISTLDLKAIRIMLLDTPAPAPT